MSLPRSGRFVRTVVKRSLYSMLSLREAMLVLAGRSKSYVRFTVEASPPSVFINFRVPPDSVAALEQHLDLLPGFTIEKIKFLEGDAEPYYYISLNVYRVSGITNALRAEWSVFVRNAAEQSDVTRYMVVEAQSSRVTMDPVNIFARSRRVTHKYDGKQLDTYVASFNNASFRASCTLPDDTTLPGAFTTREWLKSIDLIYWPNGIGDRTFYDGGLAGANILLIPPKSLQIEDTTVWSRFIDPIPEHVLLFPEAIEFVMSPWWNI